MLKPSLKKKNQAILFSFNPLMQSDRSYNAILYNINVFARQSCESHNTVEAMTINHTL